MIKFNFKPVATFEITNQVCPKHLQESWDLSNPIYEAVKYFGKKKGSYGLLETYQASKMVTAFRTPLPIVGSFTLVEIV